MKDLCFTTIIRNGVASTPDGAQRCDIAITDGRIAALLEPGTGEASEIIDASGLVILPGAIDIHCHVRSPAFPERGTVESETRAAAAGGITTLFEMPITKPCCNSAERVEIRRDHFAERSYVNFSLFAAPGSLMEDDVDAMVEAGIIAFKFFTTSMPAGREDEFSGLAFDDEGDHMKILRHSARTGVPVVVHAESAQLVAAFEKQAAGLDPAAASTHNASRPAVCEAVAVAKLLTMNMSIGAKLHIAHVTCAETVDVLRRFAGSSDFSAETCPHYLVRTVDDVEKAGVYAKINPPIRTKADQDALWQAIADGVITHVTTDHASFAKAEKAAHLGNFTTAPAGSPGLEVLVPVVLDGVRRGAISLKQAVDLVSGNAAERFRLPRKGKIAVGADADLVLVDLAADTVVDSAKLFTHAREVNALYDGMRFGGRVASTVVAGRTIYAHGEIMNEAGWGKFTRPC